jgi:hypothetical protein
MERIKRQFFAIRTYIILEYNICVNIIVVWCPFPIWFVRPDDVVDRPPLPRTPQFKRVISLISHPFGIKISYSYSWWKEYVVDSIWYNQTSSFPHLNNTTRRGADTNSSCYTITKNPIKHTIEKRGVCVYDRYKMYTSQNLPISSRASRRSRNEHSHRKLTVPLGVPTKRSQRKGTF